MAVLLFSLVFRLSFGLILVLLFTVAGRAFPVERFDFGIGENTCLALVPVVLNPIGRIDFDVIAVNLAGLRAAEFEGFLFRLQVFVLYVKSADARDGYKELIIN